MGGTNTWIFRFKYWSPFCNTGYPSGWKSITGATLRANYAPTDFALLELNTIPPVDYELYYAGWDRSATPAQNVTAIHHPKEDAMKISYDQHPVVSTSYNSMISNHWRAIFEQDMGLQVRHYSIRRTE